MKGIAFLFLSLIILTNAFAVTLPYTFTTNVPPSEANANFSAVRDAINAHEALTNGHNTDLADVLAVNNSVSTYSINFNDKELFSARVENLASDPTCSAGLKGKMIFNTVDGLLKVCDGSSFISIAGTGVNTLASVLSAGNSASTDIDMNGNELLDARVENLSSDPSAGSIGRLIFNTIDSTLKVDTGSVIQAIGGAQGLASVLGVSNSAGSTNLNMNGQQVLHFLAEKLSSDPGTTVSGRVYYNTTSNKLRFYDGTSWEEVGNTNTLAQTMDLGNSTGSNNLDLNGNELLNAKIENLAAPPGTGELGRFWFDTISEQVQFGTSGSNRTVVTTEGTQTLEDKSISGSDNTITGIPDSALSANVCLLDDPSTVTGLKTFSAAPIISRIKASVSATNGHLIPNVNDDEFVLKDAVQALAGKTLNAPTLSGHLDFAGFQAVNMRLQNLTANPTNTAGRIYYNTNTGELRYGTGSQWRVLTTNISGSGIQLTDLSATAPLAYDNTTGVFSIPQANDSTDGFMDATDHAALTQALLDIVTAQTAADDAQTAADAAQQTADDHIADPTGAHAASAISNSPSGNLAATDVQGALNELQTEIDGITPGTGDVVGPASATDNGLAVYDDTTGKLIRSSTVTEASGVLTATGFSGPLTGDVTGNVSGTAANVTGTVAEANGGTGETSYTNGQILIGNGTGLTKATLTEGLGIDITNGSGTITIAQGITAPVNISGTDINWSLVPDGGKFYKTLSANTTFTFSNTADGQTIIVKLLNTASNYTADWPTVLWSGGAAPTITVGAKTSTCTFVRFGSDIVGSCVLDMY